MGVFGNGLLVDLVNVTTEPDIVCWHRQVAICTLHDGGDYDNHGCALDHLQIEEMIAGIHVVLSTAKVSGTATMARRRCIMMSADVVSLAHL